ncbi:MAG TPA: tRNA lysidine(34) synthetase TilS [Thermoanaerobaculia bacterium]|nr:tRNA lysidine(34) synthetase TilS [Thermoanaerobaculia bacterium]
MSPILEALSSFFLPPARPGRPFGSLRSLRGARGDRPHQVVEVEADDLLIVAFSGGPDSLALLAGLARFAPPRRLRLLAAHLDHGLDAGSAERAGRAMRAAEGMGIEHVVARRDVPELARPGESPEAAARRVRYRFLEEVRRERGGRWIVTGHHRDDQAETVLLRLLQGTGPEGLAGVRPVHGRVVRPLLGLSRRELRSGLPPSPEPVLDPTNEDLRVPRNSLRHALLPALEADSPGAAHALARLAGAARGAREAVERRLAEGLAPRPAPGDARGVAIERAAFLALPEPLRPHALALLHRTAGAPYPAGRAAREELARQLGGRLAGEGGARVGCDAPGGWRWESAGPLVVLARRRPDGARETASFSYRLPLPGEVEVPEIGVTVRIRREPVAPWMFRGSPRRAALALPPRPGQAAGQASEPGAEAWLTVRNRRPGDRLRPLGAPGTRKLKEVLIDARVPRRERDRLPLLCVGGRIAWVPGVTVDEAFRVPGLPEAPAGARPDDAADERFETWTTEVIP